MQFKLTPFKNDEAIKDEWDALSLKRFDQISSGSDLTYNHILVPEMLRLLGSRHFDSIIDVGCGTGVLTSLLAKKGTSIVGIDPSSKSIEIARNINPMTTKFFCSSIEKFAIGRAPQFDAVIANMVLMDTIDLDKFVHALSIVTAAGGYLIFCITHPMFWPSYYGYETESWFRYDQQIVIEAPFRTSLDPHGDLVSTHIHRPLSMYFDCMRNYGFNIDTISEPMPSEALQIRYPSKWNFPHYLFARCIKIPI